MYKKIFFLFVFSFYTHALFSQASWEPFGQNRVQYRTFEWNYFDSTHFRVFYYDQGKAHALYSLNIAEQELSHIVYMMGGRLNKKLNIIIYNTFSDYRQTNIGRQNEEINKANGGKVDIIGDNIPVYFNGDHNTLKQQINKGIASVIKDNMLFGDNLKDVVKNAVKMNLPEWYTNGYVAYIADEWTPDKEAEVTTLLKDRKKIKFNDIALLNPTLVGHSFWNFVAENYGENYISNLLYLTRYRKSVQNSIESVFKKPYKELMLEWQNKHLPINLVTEKNDSLQGRAYLTSIKIKPNAVYTQFSVSPSGNEVAYVIKKDGEYTVQIQDVKYKKTFNVLEGGVKANEELADPDYPLICWSPSGKKMAVIFQKRNSLVLKIFTTGKRKMENKVIPSNRVDRITGMCFMSDENSLAISAIKKGQSDLFSLTIRNARIEPITTDLFDDKNLVFIQNETTTGILFMSNRTTPYLGENAKSDAFNHRYNLFLYDPSKGTILTQLSNTNAAITQPIQYGQSDYAYILNEKGKLVRAIATVEKRGLLGDTFSTKKTAPTNFTLLGQSYIHKIGKVAEWTKSKKEYTLFLSTPESINAYNKKFEESQPIVESPIIDSTEMNNTTLFSTYITAFDNDSTTTSLESLFESRTNNKQRYQLYTGSLKKTKPFKYLSTFYPNFLQTSLDNTLLFTRYQPFDYNGGTYQNPPLAGFLTTSLTDVMEDYKITAGFRMGVDFNSIDYFLQFNNFRKRADWGLLFFHHSTNNTYDQRNVAPPFFSPYPVIGKVSMDYLQSNWTYPIDMLKSIRLQLGTRYDRINIQAKDQYSIGIPDDRQFWVVSRAEFVYDNTIAPILNIWKGSRVKLFGEYQYKLTNETKGFYNFGYDARNYLTLYKNIIFASRIAGAHSGGNAKILYFMGGVDNDLNPKFDGNTSIDYSQNYAFQSLATNLRGYRQGARNGNSFMVLNEEIRFPIYNTLFKRPTKSGLLRNLQLISFLDIGSAWKGILPNSDNIKSQNFVQDPNSPVTVYIENSRYDFGMGYGLGLRSRVLGYFIRTDFAWNIEGSKKPIIHFSMATDF